MIVLRAKSELRIMKSVRYNKARAENLMRAESAARDVFACNFDADTRLLAVPARKAGFILGFAAWLVRFRLVRSALQAI